MPDDIPQSDTQPTDMEGVIKLAKYVTWPNDPQMSKATIMIAPKSDETYMSALKLAQNRKILDAVIELKKIELTDEALNETDIIFIESGSSIDIDKIIKDVAERQILTITNDVSIFEKGCMFYVKQDQETGRTDYLYNKDVLLTSRLRINSSILMPAHKYEKQH